MKRNCRLGVIDKRSEPPYGAQARKGCPRENWRTVKHGADCKACGIIYNDIRL